MDGLRLGIEVRDFDLHLVGFTLFVLTRGRHDGSGGYLQMTLEEMSRFIAALRAAEDVELVSLEAERDEPPDEPDVVEELPEPPSADVIPMLRPSRGRGGEATTPTGSVEPAVVAAEALPDVAEEPRKIRVNRRELRQPALF